MAAPWFHIIGQKAIFAILQSADVNKDVGQIGEIALLKYHVISGRLILKNCD